MIKGKPKKVLVVPPLTIGPHLTIDAFTPNRSAKGSSYPPRPNKTSKVRKLQKKHVSKGRRKKSYWFDLWGLYPQPSLDPQQSLLVYLGLIKQAAKTKGKLQKKSCGLVGQLGLYPQAESRSAARSSCPSWPNKTSEVRTHQKKLALQADATAKALFMAPPARFYFL